MVVVNEVERNMHTLRNGVNVGSALKSTKMRVVASELDISSSLEQ